MQDFAEVVVRVCEAKGFARKNDPYVRLRIHDRGMLVC